MRWLSEICGRTSMQKMQSNRPTKLACARVVSVQVPTSTPDSQGARGFLVLALLELGQDSSLQRLQSTGISKESSVAGQQALEQGVTLTGEIPEHTNQVGCRVHVA